MADFKISRGLQASYDAMTEKDSDTIFVCLDTGLCYLGDIRLSPERVEMLTSGQRVFLNGVDVTDDTSMQQAVANASSHWYGSQGSYNELVDNNQVQAGIAYHIMVQPDWNESNTKHLGYILNKPSVLDVTHVDDHILKFFYK